MASHWLEMWLLISWRCYGSLVGDVMAHWLEMWWLIGVRCGGSLIVRVVADRLFMGRV